MNFMQVNIKQLFIIVLLNMLCVPIISQSSRCNVDEQERILLKHDVFSQQTDRLESQTAKWIASHEKISIRENFELNVVVHIVYQSEEENISDEQIESQLAVLNQDFQAHNEDYNNETYFSFNKGNAHIAFTLATIDPFGNPTNGITRTFTPEINIGEKKDLNGRLYIKHSDLGGVDAWPTESYINIWVGSRQSSYGEGSRPGLSLENEDGIVIDPDYFGTEGSAAENSPFNLGRVCTHEMGHFLNLIHIWGSEPACTSDDLVNDTPPQKSPYFGCPNAEFDCGAREMINNFMDYVDDACMFYFTKGQVNRMWACLHGPRSSLLQNPNGGPNLVFPDERPFWIKYVSGLEELQIYLANDYIVTRLDIYSLDGKHINYIEGQFQDFLKIDARQWETGPYIVCLQSGKHRWTEKLIKY